MHIEQIDNVFNALMFAAKAHKHQRRKGDEGAPYLNHLVEVVYLLTHFAHVDDVNVLQAAILHDVIEDTDTSIIELEKHFNIDVVNLVQASTDDKSLSLNERREQQRHHLVTADDSVKVIKLADHCSNIASIPPDWSKDKAYDYKQWSREVVSLCRDASFELANEYQRRANICLDNLNQSN